MTALISTPDRTDTLLTKVRLIFEAFEGERRRMTLSEISRRSGLAKSTVHRLVAELVEHGYLNRSDNTYQLGARLFWLGQRVPEHEDLRQAALPQMVNLFLATNEPIYLAVLGRGEVLYVEKLIGSHGIGSIHQMNTRAPLHATASGKVLLAYSDPETLRANFPAAFRRYTPHSIAGPAAMTRALAGVRNDGYAVTRQELVPGYGAVAVPLTSSGRLVGALAVAPPVAALNIARILPLLQGAARRTTAQLECRWAS